MLARIVRYILLGGMLVGVLSVLRWLVHRLRRAPETGPEDYDALGRLEPRFAEALELRDRITELAADHDLGLRSEDELLREIDAILEPLARLSRLHVDLGRHLEGLDVKLTGGDRGEGRVAAQREKIGRLKDQKRRLQLEVAGIVTELRQIYLDLLEGLSVASLDGPAARERAQAIAEGVQLHVEAAAEVREALAELEM